MNVFPYYLLRIKVQTSVQKCVKECPDHFFVLTRLLFKRVGHSGSDTGPSQHAIIAHPYESLAMCPGRPEQSNRNHLRGHYKCECEDNAHRGAQPPRNATPRRENGFVPSLVPTTIQPSEILHQRFCLHSHDQQRYQKNARVLFSCFGIDAACTLRRPESYTRWTWLARVRMAGNAPRALRGRVAIPRARRRSVGRSYVACPGPPCGISAENQNWEGRRCGSAVTGGKGKARWAAGEWRTLMEVKEPWTMPFST